MSVYIIKKKSKMPHQQRVIDEANELGVKLSALDLFISENDIFKNLHKLEQNRLNRQLFAMDIYFGILKDRIKNF